MTVYVDPAIWPWRGRRWCHLRADEPEELFAFAALLGLPRAWLQTSPGRPWKDHYDLPEDLRFQAVALGAVEIDIPGAAALTRRLRARHDAATGVARRRAPGPGTIPATMIQPEPINARFVGGPLHGETHLLAHRLPFVQVPAPDEEFFARLHIERPDGVVDAYLYEVERADDGETLVYRHLGA